MAQTGAGKTTLLERVSCGGRRRCGRGTPDAGVAAWVGSAVGGVPGAKGGPDAAEDAQSWAEAMTDLGLHPDRVGCVPVRDAVEHVADAAGQLRASLHKLAKTITASMTCATWPVASGGGCPKGPRDRRWSSWSVWTGGGS